MNIEKVAISGHIVKAEMARNGYMMENADLSDRIRLSAERIGGLKSLSEAIEVPRRTLGNWLTGTNPKPQHLRRISEVCGVDIDWLLTGEGWPDQTLFEKREARRLRALQQEQVEQEEFKAVFSRAMAAIDRRVRENDAPPVPKPKKFLDEELMERLARVVVRVHADLEIWLAPEKVVVLTARLLNQLAQIVDMSDAYAVDLAIPELEQQMRSELALAGKEPGTGKRSA